eukprot:UN01885
MHQVEEAPNRSEQTQQLIVANQVHYLELVRPLVIQEVPSHQINYEEAMKDEHMHCCGCCNIRIVVICLCLFMVLTGIITVSVDGTESAGINSYSYGSAELYIVTSIFILIPLIGIYGAIKYNECCCRVVEALCVLGVIAGIFWAATIDIFSGLNLIFICAYFALIIHQFCNLINKHKMSTISHSEA